MGEWIPDMIGRIGIGLGLALALGGCGLSDEELQRARGNSAPPVAGSVSDTPPEVQPMPVPAPLPSGMAAPAPDARPSPRATVAAAADSADKPDRAAATGDGPSFGCGAGNSDVEASICADPDLARLDRRMAARYAALRSATPERDRERLAAEQRAFLRALNACADDSCVTELYRRRLREARRAERAADRPDRDLGPGRIAMESCADELGQGRAERLVRQCIEVSPATRPPCNVVNSCQMIRSEIVRGCDLLDPTERPDFCGR